MKAKDKTEAVLMFRSTGKHDTLHVKYSKEVRFNLLSSADREAAFLAIEDHILESASQERKSE